MYKITLNAPSLCLLGMPDTISETYSIKVKPTTSIIDKFVRNFSLKYSVELDNIRITVKKDEIKPLDI